MIFVQIEENVISPVDSALVERAVRTTLAQQQAGEVDLTVVLADDSQLQELNLKYLGIDAPTDVLSFPADFIDPDSQERYLGDILISVPRAQAQAEAAGHPVRDEIMLLTVHGVLHLLGHDHAEAEEKRRMWAAQDQILSELRMR